MDDINIFAVDGMEYIIILIYWILISDKNW
jgi:hypothetical protein